MRPSTSNAVRSFLGLVTLALFLSSAVSSSDAQSDTTSSRSDPELEKALENVAKGKKIRVGLSSGEEVKGKYGGILGSDLTLSDDGRTDTYPLLRVTSVERKGKSAGKGFLIGAAIGVGIGILGAIVVDGANEADSQPGTFIVVPLAVGAVGGGIGAAIGAFLTKWSPVYPVASAYRGDDSAIAMFSSTRPLTYQGSGDGDQFRDSGLPSQGQENFALTRDLDLYTRSVSSFQTIELSTQ
jgi:hypothetical protein